jgi:precorrin-2 C20-methyltransferase/precorrin-3B C17-methyltransferase
VTTPLEPGKLFGVGLGPGDPELLTVKAQRIVGEVDVVAYFSAQHGRSMARQIVAPYLRDEQIEVPLVYPVTTEKPDHPAGYEGAIAEFYDASAETLAGHLSAGRSVAVVCEGDPFLYGSYMYLHDRLAHRFVTEVVPGVTSFSAAAAAAGRPLTKRDDILTILPGTLPVEELTARLEGADAAVVLKLGRRFDDVREATRRAGVLDEATYVERVSWPDERCVPLTDVDGPVPYMSLVLIPTRTRTPRNGAAVAGSGHLSIVGLGPAGPQWLTPEAAASLAHADVLVGYAPYLARVPQRHGQRRIASDNRVELARANEALELAAAGSHVAVVSSGDPGIFAMASAVLEAVDDQPERFGAVDVRVVPGLSAMQAAAAKVGAPLGHDFCVVSLSDQLKPWSQIERRLDAAASADFVLALYNPASRARRDGLTKAIEVVRRHRDPATPTVVARAVGTPAERVTVTSLAELDLESVDMRTLLIIGSSRTRVIRSASGPSRVYTPRSYPG